MLPSPNCICARDDMAHMQLVRMVEQGCCVGFYHKKKRPIWVGPTGLLDVCAWTGVDNMVASCKALSRSFCIHQTCIISASGRETASSERKWMIIPQCVLWRCHVSSRPLGVRRASWDTAHLAHRSPELRSVFVQWVVLCNESVSERRVCAGNRRGLEDKEG